VAVGVSLKIALAVPAFDKYNLIAYIQQHQRLLFLKVPFIESALDLSVAFFATLKRPTQPIFSFTFASDKKTQLLSLN
jgi:hypothetical protein